MEKLFTAACLLLISACIFSLSSAYAASDDNVPMNRLVVDSYINKSAYSYAPSIVYWNGQYHAFFCGQTEASESGSDGIHYIRSTDDGKTWSLPKTVLFKTEGSPGTVAQVCDPSVIYHEQHRTWYMYYTGTQSDGRSTIHVARSSSIENGGSWQVYKGNEIWGTHGSANGHYPIIKPYFSKKQTREYGAGQTSVYYAGGKINIWYNDDSQASSSLSPVSRQYKVTTTGNAYNLSSRLSTNVLASSVEVRNDMSTGKLVMYYIDHEHGTEAALVKRIANDDAGKVWSAPITICSSDTCFPDFAHNLGVSSDLYGNLLPGVYSNIQEGRNVNLLGYGATIDPVYTSRTGSHDEPSPYRYNLHMSKINLRSNGICQLTYPSETLINFVSSRDDNALWPASSLIDKDLKTVYSSQYSPSFSNINGYQVAVWGSGSYPRKIQSLLLHARYNKTSDQMVNFLSFPSIYDIYSTNINNTAWEYRGRFSTQPQKINMGGYENAYSAKIVLPDAVETFGFLVRPVTLGADDYGNAYFQLAEIEAETWRICK